MTLPLARQLTINATDPIPSDLLNKLQDAIVGNKKPSTTRTLSPYTASVLGLSPWTTIGVGYVQSIGGASNGLILLPMETGDRLTGITCSVWGSGGGGDNIHFQVDIVTAAMAQSSQITIDTGRASAWGDLVLTTTGGGAFVPHVMAAGEAAYLELSGSAAGQRVGNIRYTYDRL